MTKVSGLTIIRNAFSNGYLIAEVIDNLLAISDEVIVCDGYSTDGTTEYLQSRDDIKLFQDHWDLNSRNGLEFAKITNDGLARCTGDYIFYLQADELIHESQLSDLQALIDTNEFNAIVCDFYHLRYDFDHIITGGYPRAIRVIRNNCGISSEYDGYSFRGNIDPCHFSDIAIYHFGFVFLRNIFNKMINHSDYFYNGADNYHQRRELVIGYLTKLDNGEILDPLEIQKALEPEYTLCKHDTTIPSCTERLRNAISYSLPEG